MYIYKTKLMSKISVIKYDIYVCFINWGNVYMCMFLSSVDVKVTFFMHIMIYLVQFSI